ncbi:signal peptidase I [Litchfieldia salsa]|uniref:Signal peptidase I n=1 Tax=Litchfieldia salsa TaxID=930152 RepID=A0A1H0R8V8_9BACI|nr:signal peptidase I [Litchfieldia salsa]SDP25983.1 signal peptidase I [Litchfieldia salsa]
MTRQKNELFEWLKALAIAVILAAVIRYFLFAPIIVDGYSMMPTLQDKDRMLVNKIGYLIGNPNRFDIVVFHATEEKDYIKRIIGLPGDHIEYKDDILYINGQSYDEPYLVEYKKEVFDAPLTEPFEIKVPDGHLFVMGDNRRQSRDSRHIGPVSIDEVMGKTNMVYWPFADIRMVD